MYTSAIFASTLLALASALPAVTRGNCKGDECTLLNFYLVTTSSCEKANSSKNLPDVSAISVFDPNYQAAQILRTIEPGYNSLPTFNITAGQLHTISYPGHSVQPAQFNSSKVTAGSELSFINKLAKHGQYQLEIIGGYLLNVAGSKVVGSGWTLCDGPLGETVIYYKGTDASCTPTYVQAYSKPPY